MNIMPHHFVDIMRANACDWTVPDPSPLGHQLAAAVKTLFEHPDTELEIAFGRDDICDNCSARINNRCTSPLDTNKRPGAPDNLQDYNELIDTRFMQVLGIKPGDRMKASDLARLLHENNIDFHAVYRETDSATIDEWTCRIKQGIANFITAADKA